MIVSIKVPREAIALLAERANLAEEEAEELLAEVLTLCLLDTREPHIFPGDIKQEGAGDE